MGGDEKENKAGEDTAKTSEINYNTVQNTANELTKFKYDLVIANIPIPFDILMSLDGSGLKYNKDILNPVSSLSKYSQNNSKALNLGIYGGDLAYCITHDQFNEVAPYLKSAKTLADDLGIPLAFDQLALAKFNRFNTNRDSLEQIIFASYDEVDKTLKSNNRIGLASLVITGGWIEGLYTTTKTLGKAVKDDKTTTIYAKIWQQKNSLDELINLLEQFNAEAAFASLFNEMNALKSIYDNLKVKTEVNADEVQSISKKVEEIRSKIVAG